MWTHALMSQVGQRHNRVRGHSTTILSSAIAQIILYATSLNCKYNFHFAIYSQFVTKLHPLPNNLTEREVVKLKCSILYSCSLPIKLNKKIKKINREFLHNGYNKTGLILLIPQYVGECLNKRI